MLTVGELAERIWRGAGREGDPDIDLVGIRRGETLTEVLTAPGEELGDEAFQGIAPIDGDDLHGRPRLGRRAPAGERQPRGGAGRLARGDAAARTPDAGRASSPITDHGSRITDALIRNPQSAIRNLATASPAG